MENLNCYKKGHSFTIIAKVKKSKKYTYCVKTKMFYEGSYSIVYYKDFKRAYRDFSINVMMIGGVNK